MELIEKFYKIIENTLKIHVFTIKFAIFSKNNLYIVDFTLIEKDLLYWIVFERWIYQYFILFKYFFIIRVLERYKHNYLFLCCFKLCKTV